MYRKASCAYEHSYEERQYIYVNMHKGDSHIPMKEASFLPSPMFSQRKEDEFLYVDRFCFVFEEAKWLWREEKRYCVQVAEEAWDAIAIGITMISSEDQLLCQEVLFFLFFPTPLPCKREREGEIETVEERWVTQEENKVTMFNSI